jgi:hypothetical protein
VAGLGSEWRRTDGGYIFDWINRRSLVITRYSVAVQFSQLVWGIVGLVPQRDWVFGSPIR